MEFVFELLSELIIEGIVSVTTNQKISKWIRYPLIAMLAILVALVILLVFWCGIWLWNMSYIASIIFIIIAGILFVFSIRKFKQVYIDTNHKSIR